MSEKTENKEEKREARVPLELSDEDKEMLEFLKTHKKTAGRDMVQRAIHHNHGFVCSYSRKQIY